MPEKIDGGDTFWKPERRVALTALLGGLRYCLASKESIISDRLPNFFDTLRGFSFGTETAQQKRLPVSWDDSHALRSLLRRLDPSIKVVEQAGLFGNPWTAAALHRNEVKNARVLAWFLDPKGGHGCGDLLLADVLRHLGNHLPIAFPDRPSRHCIISPEECPDGSNASRVDIQIDDQTFFIIVEVKIGAQEQPGQLERYCRIALERACGRPWGVVLLTPGGDPSRTAGDQSDHVVPIAWSTLAAWLRRMARGPAPDDDGVSIAAVPQFLANTFADHISNF